ncbi:hypothetical protein D9611_012024 [Ephemerocybe angulata]|uniref:Uncharacterized protein n=1 Tax=Ephemerocybe angulata TaxID=980116 RepID=A0A8H5AUF2_9AGAR|nr:hypothetical protein D9611_012024 [Tulosesus angulatus]
MLNGAAQQRLFPQLKALILEDPPTMALGMPDPAGAWFPPTNPGIPNDQKLAATVAWLTGHYKHGDLSSRDLGMLSYVNPGTHKVPSIYNNMHQYLHEILYAPPVGGSDILTFGLAPQLHEAYRKACFSSETKALFPEMKITAIAHEETVAFCIAALWEMQADSERYGGESIQFDVIPHTNHFTRSRLQGAGGAPGARWKYPNRASAETTLVE